MKFCVWLVPRGDILLLMLECCCREGLGRRRAQGGGGCRIGQPRGPW